jgi:hypothetical protein
MTHRELRRRVNIFSVASFTKIKAFAKVQRDSTLECPTVDERPSGDVELGIPMTVLNAYELRFLAGE